MTKVAVTVLTVGLALAASVAVFRMATVRPSHASIPGPTRAKSDQAVEIGNVSAAPKGSPDEIASRGKSRPSGMLAEAKPTSEGEGLDAAGRREVQDYDDTLICRDYLHILNAVLSRTQPEDYRGTPPSVLAATLESLELARQKLEQNRERCAGVTQEGLDKRLFDLTLALGLKGYQPAQACFVEGPFIEADYYRGNEAIKASYLANAPDFIGNLLVAGDWPTTLFALSMLGNNFGDPLSEDRWWTKMELPDPYLVYRSVRLAYYRYPPDHRNTMEKKLQYLEEKYRFSGKSMQDADAWARQIYSEKFDGLPPLTLGEPVSGCR